MRGSTSNAVFTVTNRVTIDLNFIADKNPYSTNPLNMDRSKMEVRYPNPGTSSNAFLDF